MREEIPTPASCSGFPRCGATWGEGVCPEPASWQRQDGNLPGTTAQGGPCTLSSTAHADPDLWPGFLPDSPAQAAPGNPPRSQPPPSSRGVSYFGSCLLLGSASCGEHVLRPVQRKGPASPILLRASPLQPINRRIVRDHLPGPAAADIWSLSDLRHPGTMRLGLARQ